jgi:hypothetical protein
VYEVVETVTQPLPQKRGACVKVYAAAVRKNGTFTVKDITDALPEVKSAPYWVRPLARDAFFRESAASRCWSRTTPAPGSSSRMPSPLSSTTCRKPCDPSSGSPTSRAARQ